MRRLGLLCLLLASCAHRQLTPEEQEERHWLMVRQCNELCHGRGLLRVRGDVANCYCVTT